jgi:hypothetical protein
MIGCSLYYMGLYLRLAGKKLLYTVQGRGWHLQKAKISQTQRFFIADLAWYVDPWIMKDTRVSVFQAFSYSDKYVTLAYFYLYLLTTWHIGIVTSHVLWRTSVTWFDTQWVTNCMIKTTVTFDEIEKLSLFNCHLFFGEITMISNSLIFWNAMSQLLRIN